MVHATELGASASDGDLWSYAVRNTLAIVTKDADFSHRIMLSQSPPWVVHLRFGNLRRREYHLFLRRIWPQVENLLPVCKLINVFVDRIEGVQ